MSRFDDDLRSTLRGGTPHVDVDAFLGDVHAGARRRRQRRAVGMTAAAVLVVAGAAGLVLPGSGPHSAPPVAGTSTPAPTASPSTSPSASPSASPSTSPSKSPAPPVPTASGTPTMSNGRPAPTGIRGYDIAGDGTLWRVTDEPCDTVMCSRVSSYDGTGAWTSRADLSWPDPSTVTVDDGGPAKGVTVAPDGRDLWAYGGRLWSSHDGGRTWTEQGLSFKRSGAAEVAVAAGEAVLRTNDGHLSRSPVGADDWTSLALPSGMDYSEQVLGLGDTLVVRGRSPQFDLLVATSDDGGDTWTVNPGPCNPEQPAFTVAEGSLFAVCPAGDGAPTSGADIMRSDDQGRTWSKAVAVRPRTAHDMVYLFVPVDRSSVYEIGSSGALLVFPEGEKQYGDAVPAGKDASLVGGRFVTPEHGYLQVDLPGTLLETTDGGQSWKPIG